MSDEVHLYNARSRVRIATIQVHGSNGGPGQPLGAVFSPEDRVAWVTLEQSGEIAELDLEKFVVRQYIPTGEGPDGLAIVP